MVFPEPKVNKDLQVFKEAEVTKVNLVHKVLPDQKDNRALLVIVVIPVNKVLKDQLVLQVWLVPLVKRVTVDKVVPRELLVHLDLKVQWVAVEPPDPWVSWVPKVVADQRVLQAHLVSLDLQDDLDLLVPLVILVNRDLQVKMV